MLGVQHTKAKCLRYVIWISVRSCVFVLESITGRILVQIGDTILKVDGTSVTLENYEEALLGCDVPGTKVHLTVRKPEVRS